MLFAQVLECDLNALIVELLKVSAELIAAVGPTVEELTHDTNRCVWFSLKHRCASNVDGAVKVKIINVAVDLPYQESRDWFIADTQHFRPRSDWSYVLVTPTNFVIETEAGDCCAIGVELDTLGSRQVIPEIFRKWHLYAGYEVDDHPDLLALGSLRRAERCDD
jgi:hypothetical protein